MGADQEQEVIQCVFCDEPVHGGPSSPQGWWMSSGPTGGPACPAREPIGGKQQPHQVGEVFKLAQAVVEELGPDERALGERILEEQRRINEQQRLMSQADQVVDQDHITAMFTEKLKGTVARQPFRRAAFQALAAGAAVVSDYAMQCYQWAQDRADDAV